MGCDMGDEEFESIESFANNTEDVAILLEAFAQYAAWKIDEQNADGMTLNCVPRSGGRTLVITATYADESENPQSTNLH